MKKLSEELYILQTQGRYDSINKGKQDWYTDIVPIIKQCAYTQHNSYYVDSLNDYYYLIGIKEVAEKESLTGYIMDFGENSKPRYRLIIKW